MRQEGKSENKKVRPNRSKSDLGNKFMQFAEHIPLMNKITSPTQRKEEIKR